MHRQLHLFLWRLNGVLCKLLQLSSCVLRTHVFVLKVEWADWRNLAGACLFCLIARMLMEVTCGPQMMMSVGTSGHHMEPERSRLIRSHSLTDSRCGSGQSVHARTLAATSCLLACLSAHCAHTLLHCKLMQPTESESSRARTNAHISLRVLYWTTIVRARLSLGLHFEFFICASVCARANARLGC